MQTLHHLTYLQDSYICFALRWPNILHCHDQTLPVRGGHPNLCTPVNILEAIYKGEISKVVAGYHLELLTKGQRSPTILFTFQQTVLVLMSTWQFCLSTQQSQAICSKVCINLCKPPM